MIIFTLIINRLLLKSLHFIINSINITKSINIFFSRSQTYQNMYQSMNKTFDNGKQSNHRIQILSTLHKGFNNFYDVSFPSAKRRSRTKLIAKRIMNFTTYNDHKNDLQKQKFKTQTDFQQSCPILATTLKNNKSKLGRVKTQVQTLRNQQFSDYIKKSMRQQQLLNLNQNKKKHLPTLNAKIGQIVKKPTIQATTKNITYHIKYQKLVLQGWKPESRQGHTCIMHKGNAIIIGGHCSHPFSTVQVYSVDKNIWTKQVATPVARSYHTSVLYKNRFVITFGGMGVYDVSRKSRMCFNTVSLFDLSSFTNRQLRMHNQDSIQARRSHSSVLMSKNMLVFGGMNSKKQYLSDLIYLDLKQLRWYHKEYKIDGRQLSENLQTGLAKHKAISIFSKQRKHLPLYASDYMQHQGMYIFGGIYGNGQQNILLQLQFSKYVPSIKRVDYSGIPPSSIDPIVEHYSQQMILIISGDLKQREIRIFKALTKQFLMIDHNSIDFLLGGSKLLGGIGSTVNEFEGKYYIFYGLGQEGYVGNISRFVIEQKVKQNNITKKKKLMKDNDRLLVNGEMLQWRHVRGEMISSSDDEDNDSPY